MGKRDMLCENSFLMFILQATGFRMKLTLTPQENA